MATSNCAMSNSTSFSEAFKLFTSETHQSEIFTREFLKAPDSFSPHFCLLANVRDAHIKGITRQMTKPGQNLQSCSPSSFVNYYRPSSAACKLSALYLSFLTCSLVPSIPPPFWPHHPYTVNKLERKYYPPSQLTI